MIRLRGPRTPPTTTNGGGGDGGQCTTAPRATSSRLFAAVLWGTVLVGVQAVFAYGGIVSAYYGSQPSAEELAELRRGRVGGAPMSGGTSHDIGGGGGGGGGAPLLPFAIPAGQPPNLPRLEPANKKARAGEDEEPDRGIYGGRGDGKHLGGFTDFDPDGVAPNTWAHMVRGFGIKSVIDVGCGRGISTRWFLEHHAKVLCVEGSKDAVQQSFLPPPLIVEHDYSRGPWWPMDTYDAAWTVEFLEHVSRQYMRNYMQTLRKAAVVFASSSRWGGWHHVEVHDDEWWIRKFEGYGFRYDDRLTQRVRGWAGNERFGNYTLPTGQQPHPQNVFLSMKVFLNPAVLSLPAHDHLFAEGGCTGEDRPPEDRREGTLQFLPRPCGTGAHGAAETELPDSYEPLPVDMTMHERWIEAIRAGINLHPTE